MRTTTDFRLNETLYSDSQYHVSRVTELPTGQSYILKFSADDHPSPFAEHRLRKEAKILKTVAHDNVVRFKEILSHESSIALLFEDSDYQPLSSIDLAGGMEMGLFLKFSLQMAEVVGHLHSKGYLHKDLNTANFWYDSNIDNVQLGGFSIATKMGREFHRAGPRDVSYADVAFVSPELTGRTNKVLDYRADLYSLGILFYYLLTAQLPFESKDPMEVIHGHLALTPKSPKTLRPDIPTVISDIVMHLIKKEPGDRYQSAFGLYSDLEKCNQQYYSKAGIVDFQTGLEDQSFYFSIPDKLFGRREELEKLKAAFDNALKGQREVLLVSGYSGVGKSRIIQELKSIDHRNLYFTSGKFDQLGNESPLSPIISAFSALIKQILSESETELEIWKDRFEENLGANAGVIIDVIPDLELLIGSQPEVPELPPLESANRFNSTFEAFLRTFFENNRMICLFLDDLQWMDSASRQWIELQLSGNNLHHLLLIGAYRDNEVDPYHPLSFMKVRLSEQGIRVTDLNLEPLEFGDVHSMISETLNTPLENCSELARLIYRKTHGNPFFTRQCLYKLYDSSVIHFDHREKKWNFDLAEVEQLELSENVLELLTQNITALELSLQKILKSAACFGNNFEVTQLNNICKFSLDKLLSDLEVLDKLGMIRVVEEIEDKGEKYFKFAHDRLQQAAYELMEEEERKKLRLDIGMALLQSETAKSGKDSVYEIADHLNYAGDLIFDHKNMPEQLIALNLRASAKAKKATAYEQALNYIKTGVSLVESGRINVNKELLSDLYLQLAECYHMCGENEEAEKYYNVALDYCVDPVKRGWISRAKIHFYTNQQNFRKAYLTGVKAVRELGIRIPGKFIPPVFLFDVLKYKWLSRGKSPSDFLDLREMESEKMKMAMLLMATFARAAFQIQPELCVALAVRMVNLSLKYGNADGVYIGHLANGPIFHGAIMNQKKKGYDFGKVTLNLVEKYKASEYRAEVLFVVGYFAIPWIDSAETMEEYWRRAYESGLESGDHFHASCACAATVQSLFMRGVGFEEIISTANQFKSFLKRINNEEVITTLHAMKTIVDNLSGKTDSPTTFSISEQTEQELVSKLSTLSIRHFAHFHFINKMKALYLWGEYELAYKTSLKSDEYLSDSPGMLHTAEHFFYKGLIVSARYSDLPLIKRIKQKAVLRKILKNFKTYHQNNPHNFSHKYYLLNAEYQLVNKKHRRADHFYNKAINASRKYGYNDVFAMANYRCFQFHNGRGSERVASVHLKDAHHFFNKIGATGISDLLAKENDSFKLEVQSGSDFRAIGPTVVSGSKPVAGNDLDLLTILKSSEAISSQIKLSDLISALLRIIIENAGAERVLILLRKNSGLKAVAERFAGEEGHRDLKNMDVKKLKALPHSLVNYVLRSRETVVLDRASESEDYNRDYYFKNNEIKSVMCIPLSLKGEITGILYLENNLSHTVFTRDRVELLKLLSGQMAISLENSQLYENLEEKVEERTRELSVEKKKSDDLLMNILPVETAEELKKTGTARAREFDLATVLFTDFIDFTKASESMDAQKLVSEINYYYSNFDRIIQKYGIEKIKTIGDAYMCAGGLPVANLANPVETVNAALEIRDFVNEEIKIRKREGRDYFELRIGLNTGPVIAGIVGIKKFAYDIWGDAVNIAARMESAGEAGKINISAATYEEVKDHFICRYRGKIDAKNKGKIDMYFVEGIKTN